MCGVIGYSNPSTTMQDLKTLRRVMLESQIRGKHASGLAWYDGNTIQSYIKPIPMSQLLDDFDMRKLMYKSSHIAMIAHARYCTSNINYNQPIIDADMAIAHNGVITQENPATWESVYGYRCESKNDSELLLRAIEDDADIEHAFPGASIAAVMLNCSGVITFMRNNKRPLWCGKIGEGDVIASTYDILSRAGVTDIKKVQVKQHELQRRDNSR